MRINTVKNTVQFKRINDTLYKNELNNNIASQKINSHVFKKLKQTNIKVKYKTYK